MTLGSMLAAAFLLRMVVVLCLYRGVAAPTWDHDRFGWEMGWTARNIYLGRGFGAPFQALTGPTAIVPPLFVYLLAGIFRVFGLYTPHAAFAVLSLNAVFSTLTCIPLYLAMRDTLGDRSATLAGWAWVVYPYAIYFSAGRVWDYALTSMLFCTCFWLAQRLHRSERVGLWVGFGVLYGFTALSNPSIVTLLPVLLGMATWRVYQERGHWLRLAMAASVAFFLMMTPWTVRNLRTLHIAAPLRDGFWLEAYAGNHGETLESNPSDSHPASNAHEMQLYIQQGEVAYMASKKALTLQWVGHHPVAFAAVTARRTFRFWTGFWSLRERYLELEPLDLPDIFFCTTVSLFMLIGLRRWWRVDRWNAARFLLLLVIFPLPYYLTHASPDYRQPVEPEIIALFTVGMFGIRQRVDDGDDGLAVLDERNADFEAAEESLLLDDAGVATTRRSRWLSHYGNAG